MTNAQITADRIADEALRVLRDNLTVPAGVRRDCDPTVVAKRGDTVIIHEPAPMAAFDFLGVGPRFDVRATRIALDTLTIELKNFSAVNFSARALKPAAVAIAERVGSDLTNAVAEAGGDPSRVMFVSRALEAPSSLHPDQASVARDERLSLRVVERYDIKFKEDVVSVDFLYGVAVRAASSS